jgi:ferredoxin-NADP reductase
MSDIVERLRERSQNLWTTDAELHSNQLFKEAAAEIERLNGVIQNMRYAEDEDKNRCVVESERLRAALEGMLWAVCGPNGFAAAIRQTSGMAYPWPTLDAAEREATAALAQEKPHDR